MPQSNIVPPSIATHRRPPAHAGHHSWVTWGVAAVVWLCASPALADGELRQRALAQEASLSGFPQRTLAELEELLPTADAAPAMDRRMIHTLHGQAKVLVGRTVDASELADDLEAQAAAAQDPLGRAASLIIRSTMESSAGDAAQSIALAREARSLAKGSGDDFLQFAAALALGMSARMRGQPEEALASLQDALSLAEQSDNAYRRSTAYYQISVLQRTLKNAPEALAASLAAYKDGEAARNAFAMANARMAESAVMELLGRPTRELAAMEEALVIARRARSQVAEAKGLINLADIRLRRKQFGDALDNSRRSLELAQAVGDTNFVATSKANMGFALLGLGRIPEGKRLTDEAVAVFELTGQTAEIADLIGEYGRSLEQLGDYKGALGLFHRERKLYEEIALQTRQRALLEVQEKYESEKQRGEIDLLNRENALKTSEIATRELEQRVWWLLAALFALSFVVVSVLYRKLRAANELLARTNQELSVQSSRDPLTALYNRRYFQNFIDAPAARLERRQGETDSPVQALLLIDIDHFKETNDRFGHALGDAVLVAVAQRLRDLLRETDMIVRWGGEEFLVLARTGSDRIDDIAARILRAISAEPIRLNDKVIRTTASIGYVSMPLPPAEAPLSWDQAIGLVDMALYMAKFNGRNRAYGIHRLARSDAETLAAAERDLEHAWKSGLVEMRVMYGPSPTSDAMAASSTGRPVVDAAGTPASALTAP
jgi:diguanylate cyclase (GGDEF)-like protein